MPPKMCLLIQPLSPSGRPPTPAGRHAPGRARRLRVAHAPAAVGPLRVPDAPDGGGGGAAGHGPGARGAASGGADPAHGLGASPSSGSEKRGSISPLI